MIKEGKTDFYVSTKEKPKACDTSEKAIEAVKINRTIRRI